MKIGDHVIRTEKYDKRNTEHHIRTQKELEYHLDLQAQGYEYKVISKEKREKKEDFDFDLPAIKGEASAPKVDIISDTCTNCEG